MNINDWFGLELILLYEGRVHRNHTTISNQLIHLFNSLLAPFWRKAAQTGLCHVLCSILTAWAGLEAGIRSFAALCWSPPDPVAAVLIVRSEGRIDQPIKLQVSCLVFQSQGDLFACYGQHFNVCFLTYALWSNTEIPARAGGLCSQAR